MQKWNLIVDIDSCTNCNLCALACQDEHVGNSFPGYAAEMPRRGHRWIDIKQKVRGQAPMVDAAYLPLMCQHCDDAPCIKAAENDAIQKRDDGIVIIDPEKSKGQRQIVDACPYGVVFWNEELEIPQHWIFDAHLLDEGWTEPRAQKVCATEAIRAIKVEDAEMARIAEAEGLAHLHPEYGTKPRVWYKNLHRYTQAFIGGSVSAEIDGRVECVANAQVTLKQGQEAIASTTSDVYGDFKFDRLAEESGAYTLEIQADGLPAKSIGTELGQSVSLTDIRLN